ncbi:hypothetical protein AUEXF2481DRAFT_4846 [Aureobasidium subglaciale EXF-2481]|uniref:Uncharacterized protein n=1 Tax=Aureobasidium subglaciale (strain EXF-2481) TaxID=1043005 RepID=A0A074YBW1_AURSE|nr:uncharacterized protein AUEXF2481DRAFT_4846 [Aureobasidium subglaciale EXF-2481]KEQ95220.1 hypothetical protein AUEXF2481DRAFT_4846 [Aureobasidium subglaciale EXF-2481]
MTLTFSLLSTCLLMPITALASDSILSRATCSDFSTQRQPFTLPGPSPFIISTGVVCSGSTPCDVPVGGFVTVNRFVNVTGLDDGTVSDLFALISSSDPSVDFTESMSNNISSVSTQRIQNGTAGYVVFTPNFRCVSGTLSGCPGGSAALTDGTFIEACAPIKAGEGSDDISGTINPVKTDEATAKAVTCNPANVSSAADAPNKACTSQKEENTSGAMRTAQLGSAVMTIPLVAFMAFAVNLI